MRVLNSGGFTLAEVMITLGIAGIGSLAVSSLLTINTKNVAKSRTSGDFASLKNLVTGLLANEATCGCALGTRYLPYGTDGDTGDPVVVSSKGTESKCGGLGTVAINTAAGAETPIQLNLTLTGSNKIKDGSNYGLFQISRVYLRRTGDPIYPASDGSGHSLAKAVLRIEATRQSSSGQSKTTSDTQVFESPQLTLRLKGSQVNEEVLGCGGVITRSNAVLNLPVCSSDEAPFTDGAGFTCKSIICPRGYVPAGGVGADGKIKCAEVPSCSGLAMTKTGRLVNEFSLSSGSDGTESKTLSGDVPVPAAPIPIMDGTNLRYECKILSCPPGRTPVLDQNGYIVSCGDGQVALPCVAKTMDCSPNGTGKCVSKNFRCYPPAWDATAGYFCIENCSQKVPQTLDFYLPNLLNDGRGHTAEACKAAGGKVVTAENMKSYEPASGTSEVSTFPAAASDFSMTRSLQNISFQAPTKYYCSMPAKAACPSGWTQLGGFVVQATCTSDCTWGSLCSRGFDKFDWGRAGIDRCATNYCGTHTTTSAGWVDGAQYLVEQVNCEKNYVISTGEPAGCSLCYASGACKYTCNPPLDWGHAEFYNTVYRTCY